MLTLSDHEILLNIQYVVYLPINQVMVTKHINEISVLIKKKKPRTSFTPSLQLQHLHLTTITVHAVLTQFSTHS